MWAHTVVCGPVARNVGSFGNNVGRNRRCLWVHTFSFMGRYTYLKVFTMKILQFLCLSAALFVATGSWLSTPVFAQDAGAPCGRDENGYPLQCVRPDPGANLESACLTTGRVQNCLPYHQNSCEIRGFQLACRLYNLGRHCYGGDQNTCNYYVALLRANTACNLDRNQNACRWLQQQQF